MNLVALHGSTTHGKDFLNTLERLGRDECLMTAVEDLPLVGDHSQVVGVTEKQAELVQR